METGQINNFLTVNQGVWIYVSGERGVTEGKVRLSKGMTELQRVSKRLIRHPGWGLDRCRTKMVRQLDFIATERDHMSL